MFRPMNLPKKTGGHFFQKRVGSKPLFFLLAFSFNFFLEKVCNLGKVGNRDYALSKGIKAVRMRIHKTPNCFLRFRQTITKYIRQYA